MRSRAGHTIATSNRLSAELAKACEGYTGVVTKGETGKPLVAVGKQRRSFSREVGARGGVVRQLDLVSWSEDATWALVRR
jgi:hypothetical protein